jgi:hypothetical protein
MAGLNGAALAVLNLALVSAVLRLHLALTVAASAAGVTFAVIAVRRVLVHRAPANTTPIAMMAQRSSETTARAYSGPMHGAIWAVGETAPDAVTLIGPRQKDRPTASLADHAAGARPEICRATTSTSLNHRAVAGGPATTPPHAAGSST